MNKYILIFLVSMVPFVELRGAIVMAVGMELNYLTAMVVCVIGNMLPVPLIYFLPGRCLSGVPIRDISENSSGSV